MTSPAITCKSAFKGSLFLTSHFLSIALVWCECPWSSAPLSIWSWKRSCFEFGLFFYLQKLFLFCHCCFFIFSVSILFLQEVLTLFVSSNSHVNSSFYSLTVVIASPWSSDVALMLWSPSTSGQLNSPCCLGHSTPLEKFGNKVYCTLQLWAVTVLRLMQKMEFDIWCFAIEVLFTRL